MRTWLLCYALAVLGSVCTAQVLRKKLLADIGAQINDVIHSAAQQSAASAVHQNADGLLQNAFTNELLQIDHRVLSMPGLEKALKRRPLQTDQDDICDRDWSHACPDSWVIVGDVQCAAPLSYHGPCKILQSFASTSSVDKHVFASLCKAPWPCRDHCIHGKDYDQRCPEGWTHIGNGFCESRTDANATCGTLYNFHDMAPVEKQEMALVCGLKWPCNTQCSVDYDKPCPDEWTEITASPGFCVAPPNYAGDCDYSVNTTELTVDQKKEFARKCSVAFPCGTSTVLSTGQSVIDSSPISTEMGDGPIAIDNGADEKAMKVVQNMRS